MQVIKLTKDLIEFQTVTPNEGGSLKFVKSVLKESGFEVICKQFEDVDSSSKPTWNIYAYTSKAPKQNLTFIGHLDVVHPGHDSNWTYPPFQPVIENGVLYGRGVCDMKATVACFIEASKKVIPNLQQGQGVSMLLTYDEEGNAINGTKKMLKFLASEGFSFSHAITGEPTCEKQVGDTVKIGRRGSVNFTIEIIGKQGHVAYPQLAKSPIYLASTLILALKNHVFDTGTPNFQPTNLEITGVETSTQETGIVPNSVKMMCNIRFNDIHTSQDIINQVEEILKTQCQGFNYKVSSRVSGESFSLKDPNFAKIMSEAILQEAGIKTNFSTSGGTSDARFMKDYASIIEFGVLNKTAHKIDESVPVEDILLTERIYTAFLRRFFD